MPIGVNLRRSEGWTVDATGQWSCAKGHVIDEVVQKRRTTCVECFNEYKRRWRDSHGREVRTAGSAARARIRDHERARERLIAEHPELAEEADRIGLVKCHARLREGWQFEAGTWWKRMS